jgi:hypothetical protein
MIPTKYLFDNYLDVLADACVSTPTGVDVPAVVVLATNALRAGSHIDVFCCGRFWEAVIVRVYPRRFRYRFLHMGSRFEGGLVYTRDFLIRWRFPVRSHDDVWKARLLAESSYADPHSSEQL